MNVKIIVGGAGFIGSNLIKGLIGKSAEGGVVVLDNMSRGKESFISQINADPQKAIRIFRCDASIPEELERGFSMAMSLGNVDEVWHFAANSDIPAGVLDSKVDLNDTFLTTYQILRAMKVHGIKILNFASSSAIYGDLGSKVLHEEIGPLLPISNYGAMKLASEAMISAAAESYLDRANIFRFPNVVGVPATHGVILDFINKLNCTPSSLKVLGDGSQQKSYLHVSDLIGAMFAVRDSISSHKVQVVNIGPLDEGVTVRWIAEQVVQRVCPQAEILYGVGNKGWVGDVPKFNYSTQKLQALGWSPKLDSAGAIKLAIDEIALQLGK